MKPVSEAFCAVLMVFGLVSVGQAEWDKTVCEKMTQDTGVNAPSKPALPQSYTTRVEVNHLNEKATFNLIMQFDHDNGMAALKLQRYGAWINMIYNYKTDELFTIYTDDYNNCTIESISTSRLRFLFGWQPTTDGGNPFTPEDVFRFGGSHKAQYVNKTTVRDLPVNLWTSCEMIDLGSGYATATLMWYFLDTTSWKSAFSINGTVPVRLRVTGVTSGGKKFDHIYDFTEWETPLTDPQMFHTNQGIVCYNRKATDRAPTLPRFFKFEAENVASLTNTVQNIQEWYDSDANLFRLDKIVPDADPYKNIFTSTIHDFNVGVSYLIDRVTGKCKISNITKEPFDVSSDDPSAIRIKNPYKFMDFNRTTFRYAGKRQMRGITLDVWSMKESVQGMESTLEWYFAQNNGFTEYTTNDILKSEPKVFVYTAYADKDIISRAVWNIHNYELARPEVWNFDFSICFSSNKKRHFQFQLAANFKTVVMQSEAVFKFAVMQAISKVAGISTLRVSQIQVDYLPKSIFVTFTLLDQEPQGSVQSKKQVPLDNAASIIQTNVQNGLIKIRVPKVGVKDDGQNWELVPTTASYRELMSRNHLYYYFRSQVDGYSPGAMAGLAIAMIILGLAAGAGVMYFVYRRGGGAFPTSFGLMPFKGGDGGDDDKETLPKD